MVDHGLALEGAIEAELGDPGQLTPGHRPQAAIHEDGEEEAFPVGLSAHAGTQGLLHGALLRITPPGMGGERQREEPVSHTALHSTHMVPFAFQTVSGFTLNCLRTGTPPYFTETGI